MGISTTPARFNADFGLFWPFRSLVNTIQYGQYGPILAESIRFGVNRSQVNVNPREKKKKKSSDAAPTRRRPHQTPRLASDLGAASSQPRPCFLASMYLMRDFSLIKCEIHICELYICCERDVKIIF